MKKYLEISDFIFVVTYLGCSYETQFKLIPSVYCWVDYRFIIVTNSVIKPLKYQTIAGRSCPNEFDYLSASTVNKKNWTKKKRKIWKKLTTIEPCEIRIGPQN